MDQLTRHLDISYQHLDSARINQNGCDALQNPEVSLERLRFLRINVTVRSKNPASITSKRWFQLCSKRASLQNTSPLQKKFMRRRNLRRYGAWWNKFLKLLRCKISSFWSQRSWLGLMLIGIFTTRIVPSLIPASWRPNSLPNVLTCLPMFYILHCYVRGQ